MKPISIKKSLNNEKENFEVRLEIVPNDENFDLNKLETLLEDFINHHNHDNMIENVTILRTMLKGCQEKLLVISYEDEKISELVKYDNSNLFLYEKNKTKVNDDHNSYKFQYYPSAGISSVKLDYHNYDSDVESFSRRDLAANEFNQLLENIFILKYAEAVKLNGDEKLLIEMYKLFYNENPNFTNKDISIRIQTMVYILSTFRISMPDDYRFGLYAGKPMPYSGMLETSVDKLYPFGEVTNVEDNLKLNKRIEKIIKIIGQSMREIVASEQNLNDALITFSKIIYARRYCLSSRADVNQISEFTERTPEEVESSIKLVKKIKNKIEDEVN